MQNDTSMYPAWWHLVPDEFAKKSKYVNLEQHHLSQAASQMRKFYIERFGNDVVHKRIPTWNWKRADVCYQLMPDGHSVLDIGSGQGEFANLVATNLAKCRVISTDLKNYELYFDHSGSVDKRICNLFTMSEFESVDIVTAFEVIEHLPTERIEESIGILSRISSKSLFVSVPFLEPEPIYKGHTTRFTGVELMDMFPDAEFTIYGKNHDEEGRVLAWVMCKTDYRK